MNKQTLALVPKERACTIMVFAENTASSHRRILVVLAQVWITERRPHPI